MRKGLIAGHKSPNPIKKIKSPNPRKLAGDLLTNGKKNSSKGVSKKKQPQVKNNLFNSVQIKPIKNNEPQSKFIEHQSKKTATVKSISGN